MNIIKQLIGAAMTVAALAAAVCAPSAARAQAPTCYQAQGPDCLYFPAAQYGFTPVERSVFYTDAAGQQREVKLLIRQPLGAALPMPIAVWSHGGADGKSNPATSMAEWSELSARAGYFTVSIAHAHRDDASRGALCQSLTISDVATCKVFKYLNWDRPHDIRAVLDELERLAASELRGQIDTLRMALGGHSAGAGAAQTVAGAKRIFTGAPVDLSDTRPIAFLAFSPQQPGSEGFFDTRFGKPRHSWSDVQRPMLTATGDGDSTCNPGAEPGSCIGDTPFGRRIGFDRMPAGGDKYQLYIHDADAFHMLFELNAHKCASFAEPVKQQQCGETVRWLSSAALAFLDGHVRGSPAALQWLGSDRMARASGGTAEWRRK